MAPRVLGTLLKTPDGDFQSPAASRNQLFDDLGGLHTCEPLV